MKFGKQLGLKATSQPEWKESYVDYKLLKQFIKESYRLEQERQRSETEVGGTNHIGVNGGSEERARQPSVSSLDPLLRSSLKVKFRALLVTELEKVDSRFIQVEKRAEASLEDLNGLWRPGLGQEESARWRAGMIKVIGDLEDLLEFTTTNVQAFQKILKKWDKRFRPAALESGLSSKKPIVNRDGQDIGFGVLLEDSTIIPDSGRTGGIDIPGRASKEPNTFSDASPTSPLDTHGPWSNRYGPGRQADQPRQASSASVGSAQSPPAISNIMHNRKFSMIPIGKDLWTLVTTYKFSTTEKDEMLLHRARELYRRRVPIAADPEDDVLPSIAEITLDDSNVPIITALDIASLPYGQVSKMWVTLYEDALRPIMVPVIVAKGTRPGPTVGLTSALHGNEVNGLRVIHRLFQQEIHPNDLHGCVVAVPVANVQGFINSVRTFDGQDLNRLMPGKPDGSTPQVYCHNLIHRIVKHFDYLIDLHTASRGRVNSLYVRANMLDVKTRKMAMLQNPQIIVHNTSPDGSLRGAAINIGIPAITVEIGDPSQFQKRFVRNALLGVTNILGRLRMLPDETSLPDFAPVICSKSYWIFSDRGGILAVIPEVNNWVRKDEPIATIHSVFGQLLYTYRAPETGIVIGKEVDPVAHTGSRIIHLGVVGGNFAGEVDDGHL